MPSTSSTPKLVGWPLTEDTLSRLPPFVETVVLDYHTGDPEQRWELREHTFDLDALDNLPCARGSICEIWARGASHWVRRDQHGHLCLAPGRPSQGARLDAPAWIVERTATTHIIVWRVSVIRSDGGTGGQAHRVTGVLSG